MRLKFEISTRLYSIIIFLLPVLLSPTSAIKVDDAEQTELRPLDDSSSGEFPISYPLIKYEKGFAFVPKPDSTDNERCLFYAEGVSIVVFNTAKGQSAWADYRSEVNGRPKFTASMECQHNQNMGSSFSIYLKIDGKADGVMRADIGKQDPKRVFIAEGAEFELHFNFTQVGYWQLVGATAKRITVKSGSSPDFLNKDLNVDDKWTLGSSVVGSTNINGFKDYSFACGRTNPIVWNSANNAAKPDEYAVGITLNNVQFQPFNATYTEGGKEANQLKFGWKVSDCQGLFSIGTWMGLVVTTLLIGVLIFGFLMLNSVQTMDRFDDPKQKQLIISSKE